MFQKFTLALQCYHFSLEISLHDKINNRNWYCTNCVVGLFNAHHRTIVANHCYDIPITSYIKFYITLYVCIMNISYTYGTLNFLCTQGSHRIIVNARKIHYRSWLCVVYTQKYTSTIRNNIFFLNPITCFISYGRKKI